MRRSRPTHRWTCRVGVVAGLAGAPAWADDAPPSPEATPAADSASSGTDSAPPDSAAPSPPDSAASSPDDSATPDDSAPAAPDDSAPPDSAPPDSAAPAPPPDDPDDGWLSIGLEADFGSAVETGLEADVSAGTLPPELQGLIATAATQAPEAPRRPRGRFGVRPVLGVQGALPLEGASTWGGSAGARLVHQWWTLRDTAVRPAGETRLTAAGLFGGVSGYDLRLDTAGGTWLGPVGLFAGGLARFDRQQSRSAELLAPALGVGPSARLALELGPVVPWAGVSPTWLVRGDRAGRAGTSSDELTIDGGVVLHGRLIELRVGGGTRLVHTGQLWSGTAGLHIRF